MATETPLGDGLYLDTRCDSYVWRGRVAGKPVRKVIRHPKTGAVGTTQTMTRTEARALAKSMRADAANARGVFAPPEPEGILTKDAWKLYMEREGDLLESAPEKRSVWSRHLESRIGDTALSQVTRRECAAIIDEVLVAAKRKGHNGNAAVNLQKQMKAFFSWCSDTGYGATGLEASPMAAIKKKPIKLHLTKRPSRSLDEQELILFFRALERYKGRVGHKETPERKKRSAEALEALWRSMCRRNDIFARKWSNLQADGLFIPKTKAVGGRQGYALLLPLPPSMKALIGKKPDDVERDGSIFGLGVSRLARTIEDVREIMTEIAREEGSNADYHTKKFDGQHNPSYFTGHDARDTGKWWLGLPEQKGRYPKEVREACLNHRESGIAAVYNSELESPLYMFEQRREALEDYNRWLDGVKAKALAPKALAA